ncbi:antibiotic biosynthesis monooxygenase [Cnuibacter sp. UC19_7]|uniref:antibiotic biosynthesis monooxygenase n=1 Tax=Cnuibacter sp. UC19_7 TaxID=3350166 RepID=UPI00366B7CD0
MSTSGASAGAATEAGSPVALVIHRRLAESSYDAYEAWQERVGAALASFPGFVDRQVIRPNPPVQVDWVIVQRFRSTADARAWLQSPERAALSSEISSHFLGNDDIHLVTEDAQQRSESASVLISSRVPPELETEFLAWQRRISAVEARYDGFVGHKVERPIPGVQDTWTVVLSFDTDEHLQKWIDSPERAALLAEGADYNEQLTLQKASYGFGFWSGSAPAPDPIFKSNLIVLMMLYPIVFLWGYFVSDPLFAAHDVPFWLSLFIGNVVSTQLLGWVFVPWAFKRLGWWLKRKRRWQVHLAGYLIVCAVYVLSMALYAWLLSLR